MNPRRPLLAALLPLPALAQTRGRRPAEAPPPEPGALPPPDDYRWRVMRNGTDIGTHNVTFTQRGAELVALSDVSIVPRVLGIVVFRFEHRYTEVTRAGRFVSVRSRQNRNGTVVEVSGEAGAAGVTLRGPEGVVTLAAKAAPLSWWEPARFGGAVPIFGTTTGKLMDLRWSRSALPGGGVQWRCQGEVDATLGYNAEGRWVSYSVIGDDGSTVSYTPA
jgi:hypothetical protein